MVPSDADLLAAHVAGDPRAFGELAGRYRARMWGLAVRILDHPEDAADAVQEALVAAYRRAHTYRGDALVRTWLHRILVNLCVDRRRASVRRPTVPLADAEPADVRPDLAVDLVTRLSVHAALAALPVAQRAAVVLVDVQGWPVEEAPGSWRSPSAP
ncbi:hypothetical protein BJF78_25470 [Pseudonocardia sp. CNS-139]|nr:hypothetical protein BJF78_25470 [Pseudonocardia sp. CNS-139]